MHVPDGIAQLDPLEDLPCGIVTTDAKGLIVQANSTFCAWVGFRTEEVVAVMSIQDFLTMGGKLFYQTHLAPLIVMQGSVAEVKLELQHRDEGAVPIVFNAKRYYRDGVWLLRIAAFVARDRDRYERELLHSRKKLESVAEQEAGLRKQSEDRALFAEQMIGIVSHDLRNPLATIRLGVHTLEKKGVSPDQSKVLSKVHRATDRAIQLVKDLLDFTSARIGKGLSVTPEAIELHQVVALAVEELALAYPGRRIVHLRAGANTCQADANRIAQAIGNLVSNAVSYGDPSRDITVSSAIEDQEWKIAVHNWGKPIAAEAQKHLFSPMVRGVSADSANRNVGLGLYIVKELARAHGGSIDVVSTEEYGTIFELRVPLPAPPDGS